jgi:uncharacterized protein
MIDDAFVFDCVAHVFNFEKKNAFGPPGEMFDNHLYAFHNALTPDDQPKLPPDEFLRQWTPTDIRKMVFEESDTDMLVAMPLPLTDLFRDGLSPWEACADLASRDPDRTVFWGSVNPLEGRKALDLMERQLGEFGARAFKFYNVRYDYGSPYPWRMDDPNVAFPVFEKAQELGVNLIGVHKGVPLGRSRSSTPRPGTWTGPRPTSPTSTSSSSMSGCRSSMRPAGSSSGTRTCTRP